MIKIGRWLAVLLFAFSGLAQVGAGIAYAGGWVKPNLEGMTVPPEMQHLVVGVTSVVSIVVGLVLLLTAWGLFSWRNWGRIIAIIFCILNLLGLVVISFTQTLRPSVIAFGLIAVALLLWLFNPMVQRTFAGRGSEEQPS